MQVLFEYFDIKSEPKKYFYILYVIDSNSRGCDGRSQIRGDAGDRTTTGFAENDAIEAGEKIGRSVVNKFSYITRLVARPNAEPSPSLAPPPLLIKFSERARARLHFR